jgi:hypothetical protein
MSGDLGALGGHRAEHRCSSRANTALKRSRLLSMRLGTEARDGRLKRRAFLSGVVAVVPAGAEITVGNDDERASRNRIDTRSLRTSSGRLRRG